MTNPEEFYQKYINNWRQTPLEEVDGVYLKREDCNPTGSSKSRGVVWQVYALLQKDQSQAVISSSGNAAIAAAHYADLAGVHLHAFIAPTITDKKRAKLESTKAIIHVSEDPIRDAQAFAGEHRIPYIRQSEDPIAPKGFESLAGELLSQLETNKIKIADCSIFFPVSSATTFVGFYRGLQSLDLTSFPQLHVVQTQAVHPIASQFDRAFTRKARSVVGGIVARETAREQEALEAIEKTHGAGWVPLEDQVHKAQTWLINHKCNTSIEAALSLAGLWKAQNVKFPLNKCHIIIAT